MNFKYLAHVVFIRLLVFDCLKIITSTELLDKLYLTIAYVFVSCSSLAVWNLSKSRFPIATVKNAHDGGNSAQLVESWITAVAAVRYCDLVASGGCDFSHYCVA